MNLSTTKNAIGALVLMALLTGCGALAERTFWWPQGPGGPVGQRDTSAREPEPAPQRAASAQPPASTRQFEIAPGLVAESSPPPRSPAAAARAEESLATAGGYTQLTRYGDLVFISGQIAIDLKTGAFNESGSIEQQTRTVMENIRALLEGQRLTMANVVSTTVYLKNLADFRGMNTTYESFFRSALPSRSVVEVSRLPRNALVEVSVVAGR